MNRKITWDQIGERLYEAGVRNGILFPQGEGGVYSAGVAWNGLAGVTESPSGAEASPLYADDIKYLNLLSTEEFGATIEAYTYPDEFAQCDGSASIAKGVFIGQQKRKQFGLVYRTVLGNDVDNNDYGYKLHFIYGALAAPSEKPYSTINDSPEAITFSWEVTTTPVNVDGYKPTAYVVIDSTKVDASKLAKLESILHGSDPTKLTEEPSDWATNYKNYVTKENGKFVEVTGDSAPTFGDGEYYSAGIAARLPLPDEIATIMAEG